MNAGGSSASGVRVDLGRLYGPWGATIPNEDITIYREAYYDVTTPSDGEGATGQWPDALSRSATPSITRIATPSR